MALPKINEITGSEKDITSTDPSERYKQLRTFHTVIDELIENKVKKVMFMCDGYIFYEHENGEVNQSINNGKNSRDEELRALKGDCYPSFKYFRKHLWYYAGFTTKDYDLYDIEKITKK